MTKTERKNWRINKLRLTNYEVNRKNFGIIALTEKDKQHNRIHSETITAHTVSASKLPNGVACYVTLK